MTLSAMRATGKKETNVKRKIKHKAYSVTALALLLAIGGTAIQSSTAVASPQQVSATTSISTANFAQTSVIAPARVAMTTVAGSQYKTTIWLNLRSGAGTNYSVIGSGVTGTTVTTTGKVSGVWYEVKLGSQTGWMSSQYLQKVASAPAPTPATIAVAQYKTTIHLNLRSGAGFQHAVIGSGVAGTTVTGTGKVSGVWYEVKLGSQTGWMSSEYLQKIAAPSPAPAPAPVAAPTDATAGIQYKTIIHLNLRSGAGFQHPVIGSGVTGTTVTGTGKVSGVWYEVKLGSQTGWMSSEYLRAITGPNSVTALQAFAGSKLKNPTQLSCLVTLWDRESNWNYKAINPAFSPRQPATPDYQAFGIAQAAPGSKMATAGTDWQTNPRTQILWGLDYIAGRHGTPCSALTHSNLKGWY